MTTGSINQVHASPPDWSTLKTLTCSQVAQTLWRFTITLFALPQRDIPMCNAAHIQHLRNDPEPKAPKHSVIVFGNLQTRVLHAPHAQLYNPHSHSQQSPGVKSLSLCSHLTTFEGTTSIPCCNPITDLSHITWWSREGLQRYRRSMSCSQADALRHDGSLFIRSAGTPRTT